MLCNEVLDAEFTDDYLLTCLGSEDLGRLEAVSSSLQRSIQAASCWAVCLDRELAHVVLTGDCLAAASAGGDSRQRAKLKRLLGHLRAAQATTDVCELEMDRHSLDTFKAVDRLSAKLSRAVGSAKQHENAGDASSGAFVTQIYFPPKDFFTDVLEDNQEWSRSDLVPFEIASRGKEKKMETLYLELAWLGNEVRIHVLSEEGLDRGSSPRRVNCPGDRGRLLSIDIVSVGEAPMLATRGSRLRVDGCWQKVNGISAALLRPDELMKALGMGLLCVIVVCDQAEDSAKPIQCAHYVHFLGLDDVRNSESVRRRTLVLNN